MTWKCAYCGCPNLMEMKKCHICGRPRPETNKKPNYYVIIKKK